MKVDASFRSAGRARGERDEHGIVYGGVDVFERVGLGFLSSETLEAVEGRDLF